MSLQCLPSASAPPFPARSLPPPPPHSCVWVHHCLHYCPFTLVHVSWPRHWYTIECLCSPTLIEFPPNPQDHPTRILPGNAIFCSECQGTPIYPINDRPRPCTRCLSMHVLVPEVNHSCLEVKRVVDPVECIVTLGCM